MPNLSICAATVTIMTIIAIGTALRTVDAGGDYGDYLEWRHTGSQLCDGSTADCRVNGGGGGSGGEEFELESEISRRILATSRYISYDALRRNTVPCSRRGASYYNCRAGAQANPYSRGCSAITRCRR